MKKHLFVFAALALMATACGETTETQETTVETETIESNEGTTTEIDSVTTTEVDNTTVEIEDASAEVDSLLNEI